MTLTLEPNAVYSLTTTRGQQKGNFADVPAHAAFPFPFSEDFEGYRAAERWGYLPHYFADIYGAFELASCPGRAGACLRQSVPMRPISWAPDWKPYTVVGDDQWRDYQVSADVRLGEGEEAGVMGRVNHVGTGYGFLPRGYFLRLSASGDLDLTVARGKIDKKALVGDAEQQALIRSTNDASLGGEKLLASMHLAGMEAGDWHRLTLRFEGSSITGLVDGRPVLKVSDSLYGSGMAGLLAGLKERRMSTPFYDNVEVTDLAGTRPPRGPNNSAQPLYAAAGKRE